jgi:hypothetical protein
MLPLFIAKQLTMIGRADIEGSKSNVAMNAWLPQASSLLPLEVDCLPRAHRLPSSAAPAAEPPLPSPTLVIARPAPHLWLSK